MLAHGKVNLCLLVGAPRADGLHPLVSVVQPVALADELRLEPAGEAAAAPRGEPTAPRGGGDVDARDVVVCPGVDGPNLAARALAEFRAATGWDGAPQRLTITKRIPVAAGMGGGSADAAAALTLIARAARRAIPPGLPMRLGADVPVLLAGTRALMTGAGEHVEPLLAEAPHLIVVPLDAHLGTAAVYAKFDALGRARSERELAEAADRIRAGELDPVNDLEPAARALCPAIEPALEALDRAGVTHAMVTGSGPTVFGFSDDPDAVARLRAAGYPRATRA